MYTNPLDSIRDANLAGRGLPEVAYVDNSERAYGDSPVIAIKRGESGCYPIHTRATAGGRCRPQRATGVSLARVEAMLAGAMFGWHVKAAFPKAHEQPCA